MTELNSVSFKPESAGSALDAVFPADETTAFASIEEALEELRAGRFVVVADDEGRENEGDLICAAELVSPEMINFMISQARGWVCLALTAERAEQLNLPMMVE